MNKKIIFFLIVLIIVYQKILKGKIPALEDILSKIENILKSPPKEAWKEFSTISFIPSSFGPTPPFGSTPQLKMLSPAYCLLSLNYTDLISMVSAYGANSARFFAYCNWPNESLVYSAWGGDLPKLATVVDFCNSQGLYAVVSIFTQYDDINGLTPLSASEEQKKAYINRVVSALKGKRVIYDLTNEGGGGEWVLKELKQYGVLTCSYGSNIGADYYSVHTGQHTYAGSPGDRAFIHSTDTPSLIHLSDDDLVNIANGAMQAGGNFEFLLYWGREGREGELQSSSAILGEYGNALKRIKEIIK